MNRVLSCAGLWILVGVAAPLAFGAEAAEEPETALGRIRADVEYLAGDALEGRGVLTAGNRKAAEYIQDSFQDDGLAGGMPDGSYFQTFSVTVDSRLNEKQTRLLIAGDGNSRTLKLGESYQPLAAGSGGDARSELVFAGYGIAAPKEEYDEYTNIDVTDKVVLILRKEPHQSEPDGAFEGTETTSHAYIKTKLAAAKERGAAAVLMVNDSTTVAESHGRDRLAKVEAFGKELAEIPFAHISREAVNRLLKRAPLRTKEGRLSSLDAVEKRINATLAPISQPMTDVTVDLDFAFEDRTVEVANVIGRVPGEKADEYVVVGAHFDHIGYGGYGSRKPGVHEIHNGADDNASGTAALLELARRTAKGDPPPRSVIFIAFNGEERGLLGSNHYIANPVFPLKKTVAMLNFDMIGRWGDNPLTVYGLGTATEFEALITAAAPSDEPRLNPVANILSASDHYGFYREKVPVFHFFTGLTDEYHTPADDVETLELPGIARAVDFAERVLRGVLQDEDGFEYTAVDIERPGRGEMSYLGVVPDYSSDVDGLRIHGTSAESPARSAGFQEGDVITKFGDIPIDGIQALAKALRKYDPGKQVTVEVRRGDKTSTMTVELGEPRGSR